MPDAKPLGPAYAWQDGEQWFYTRSRDNAPEHAIEVEGLWADGAAVRVTGRPSGNCAGASSG